MDEGDRESVFVEKTRAHSVENHFTSHNEALTSIVISHSWCHQEPPDDGLGVLYKIHNGN